MILKVFVRFIRGLVIGASMLIPGVSGGCMAIILGIYDELISAVSNIRKAFVRNSLFLLNYLVGGLVGVVLLSEPLLRLLEWQEVPCRFFFVGAIIACIPPLYKRAVYGGREKSPGFKLDGINIEGSVIIQKRQKLKVTNIIAGIIGAVVGISLQYIPADLFTPSEDMGITTYIALFFAGIVLAVALVLPGISGSYMLLIFGIYDITLNAIKEFDIAFLLPIVIGALIGTFGSAKIIDNLINRHPQFIFLLIIGFMIGSLYQVVPRDFPTGILIPISIVTFAVGFTVIYILGLFADKDKTKSATSKQKDDYDREDIKI